MSKTVAPLLSFGASGQLGNTLVYATWKGRPYARRYVIPANPNSLEQQSTRNIFRGLNALYRYLPAGALGAWDLYANNSRITSRNGWIKQNLSNLRGETDLANILLSPSAGGGIAAQSSVVTPTSDGFTVAITPPDLPVGWTVAEAYAMALENVDGSIVTQAEVASDADDTDPYSITLTGLSSSTSFIVGGWIKYTKPNGLPAYGSAVQEVASTTA